MTPLARRLLAGTVLAVVACAASAGEGDPAKTLPPKPASSLHVSYRMAFWGIAFGNSDFAVTFRDGGYATVSHFETGGLVDWLWQARIEANAHGVLAPHALSPAVYDSYYQRGAERKERVKVSFVGAEPGVEAEPPFDLSLFPVSRELKRDAVDPVSAVTLILGAMRADAANPCGTTIAVYDGRRRYDVAFRYLKDEKPDVDDALWTGEAHLCQVRQHQLAGYRSRLLRDGRDFPPVYGWFVEVPCADAPSGHYLVPLEVWASTGFGTVSATLTRIEVDGAVRGPKD